MRQQLCQALVNRCASPEMLFLTGDLGFMALEPLQQAMGERFINAGVSEQNMISVGAALAREGFEVWAYSIAPFCYARPFEQIRNDIAFHHLPVKLIGNGGGYGYGVMGPTHHAIEDYGILLSLPNLSVFVPAFDQDVESVIDRAGKAAGASYIRLGRGEAPPGFAAPAYAPWRQLTFGGGPVLVAVGPLAGSYIAGIESLAEEIRPNLWALTELPLRHNPPPPALLEQLSRSGSLGIAEEHVSHGGAGSELALHLLAEGISVRHFRHFFARAHHFERYGSQGFLRAQSGLDAASVLAAMPAR